MSRSDDKTLRPWAVFIGTGVAALLLSTLTVPTTAAAAPATSGRGPCIVHSNQSMVAMGSGSTVGSIADVIRVGCGSVYSGYAVIIDATQLSTRCRGKLWWSRPYPTKFASGPSFSVTLDEEGNATAVAWAGPSCGAGTSRIYAALQAPPYTSSQTTFTLRTPRATSAGITAHPSAEIEDATYFSVATVIQVELPVAQAGKTVTINAGSLFTACGSNLTWIGPDKVVLASRVNQVSLPLDGFGNAFVVISGGSSCASGSYTITATPTSAPKTGYSTTFTVILPRPTTDG